MALTQSTVVVNNAATLLFKQNSYAGGVVAVTNLDASVDLYLGSSAVSRSAFANQVAKGGGEHELFLPFGESIYGITASGLGTINVNIMAVGQPS